LLKDRQKNRPSPGGQIMKKKLNIPTDLGDEDFRFGSWCLGEALLMSKQPAIDGKATIRYQKDIGHWGDETLTRQVENPTYTELYQVASEMISESGDLHHHFIEGFDYSEKDNCWDLVTGS